MTNYNSHDFEYRYLRPSQLVIDKTYQRDLTVSRVDKIAGDFDGDLFNEPKVSFRDGKYYVFDGQHTVRAWEKKFEDKPIYCKVFKGMTWMDEQKVFLAQTGYSSPLTTNDKFKALYNGGDRDIVNMVRGAEQVGFIVQFGRSDKSASKHIKAVKSLYNAMMTLGFNAYVDMLTVIHDAWPGIDERVNQNIIKGMSEFYKAFYGSFTQSDLIKALSRVRPIDIIREGRATSLKHGHAREIVKAYNRNRKAHRLDAEKL